MSTCRCCNVLEVHRGVAESLQLVAKDDMEVNVPQFTLRKGLLCDLTLMPKGLLCDLTLMPSMYILSMICFHPYIYI